MTDGDLDPTQAVPLPGPDPDATQVWQTAPQAPPPRGPIGRPPAGGPDGPDRRPWILVGLLAAIVAVLIAILLLRGGDDDDTVAGAGSTTGSSVADSTTSSSVAPSSTTSTTAATTTTADSTVDPAECKAAGASEAKVGQAAQALYDAWTRDDRDCAHELATDAAVDELFQRDGAGAQDQFQGCQQVVLPTIHADCSFTYDGGVTHYLGKFDGGWRFYDIQQVAD